MAIKAKHSTDPRTEGYSLPQVCAKLDQLTRLDPALAACLRADQATVQSIAWRIAYALVPTDKALTACDADLARLVTLATGKRGRE